MTPAKRRQYGTGSVYKRASDGRWVGAATAGWTERGTRRRITVTASTEAEAKRRLTRKIRERDTGNDDATTRTTVKTWSDQWLTHAQRSLRPASYTATRSAVRVWIVPTIGHRRLDQLTPGDVRAVHDATRKAGLKTGSAARTHGVLLKLLRDAAVEGHTVPQRVFLVRPPTVNANDREAVTAPHALALLHIAAGRPDGSRWAAALLQGMRQGECLGLTWDAVDLDAGLLDVSWQLQALPYVSGRSGPLRVPDGYEYRQLDGALCLVRPKTARGQRLIPLVPWMTAALTAWQAKAPTSPHRLVWPRPDGRPALAPDDRKAWRALQDDADVRHPAGRYYVLHEARHATATLLLEAGVDHAVVTAIMGHSTITTTRGYQHVSQTMARQAMDAVAARLQLT